MSDLISRQVLKDWIKSHNDVTFESSIEDMILQVVDDQPTAYDVEAVVRVFGKISNGCGEIPHEEAIEIVRGGRND